MLPVSELSYSKSWPRKLASAAPFIPKVKQVSDSQNLEDEERLLAGGKTNLKGTEEQRESLWKRTQTSFRDEHAVPCEVHRRIHLKALPSSTRCNRAFLH
jgi:hypothetical protein